MNEMTDPEATIQVSFRLTNRLKAALDDVVKRTGWTMSKLMNLMVKGGTEMATRKAYIKGPPETIANIRTQIEDYREEYEANELIARGKEPPSLTDVLARLAELEAEVKRLNGERRDG